MITIRYEWGTSMLDFRIDTFLSVVKWMNFTKAAEELCITQPAVSQHIKYLETAYQTKFFSYEGKKLRLTKAGQVFYETVSVMQQDAQRLKEMMHQTQPTTHLKFGATLTIGEYILPKKIEQLLKNYPNAKITMLVENTTMLLEKLTQGALDFVVLEGNFPKQEYDYTKYSQEKYICVASANYPFQRPIQKIEDLIVEPLIVREKGSGTRDIFERNLANDNLQLKDFKQVLEVGNIQAIKQLVQQQVGLTTIYEVAVREELASGNMQVVPLSDLKEMHDFYLVWRKNSVFSADYRKLAEMIC